jgi:hypothetical protein
MQKGGGWLSLFGLPSGIARIEKASEWKRLALGLMSPVSIGVGSALLFGRRWLKLDMSSGSLIRRYGLLIPMLDRERSVGDFTAVVIAFEMVADSPDRYPVRLMARNGKDVVISSLEQFEKARKQAEFLSRFLRLPLADTTTDHELVVSPERASETLQERLSSGQTKAGGALRPPTMRCNVDEARRKLTIVIPGRMSLTAVFSVLVACAVILILLPVLWGLFSRTETLVGVRFVFLGFLLFGFGFVPLGAAIKLARGMVVRAPRTGLEIERRGVWRTRTIAVSAIDILDVDYSTFDGILKSAKRSTGVTKATLGGAESQWFVALKRWVPTKDIVVKSRQGLVTFGEGLAAEELRFLKSVLTKAILG